jgi:hypothetical protein
MSIIPWITTITGIWFIFVGWMHQRKANSTHGLIYQMTGLLIAVVTVLAVWIKYG